MKLWPVYIFLGLACLVVTQALWQYWRNKKLRAKAQREYTAELLKQQQEANAQAQAQQQALFDSMVEGVLLLDEREKILFVNESLRKFFRLPLEARGEAIDILNTPQLSHLLQRARDEKTLAAVDLDVETGKRWHLQVNATTVFDRTGRKQGFLFVFHDLTRQKELENIREEFVANVSHELRTPLSLIKGFTETLLDGAKNDPETASRFLQKIDTHADRLLYLIEDLLTLSRLESGVALNCHEVPLRELVERVFEDVQLRARERQIALQNKIDESVSVWADADRLQQVLFNLVENAIKYGVPDGCVVVGTSDDEHGKMQIFVQDNGCGIPEDAQGRVFERFYRVDRARSRETGGTGLGLAIVKHIVLAHGGEVGVKSEVNKGSTFYFTLRKRNSTNT